MLVLACSVGSLHSYVMTWYVLGNYNQFQSPGPDLHVDCRFARLAREEQLTATESNVLEHMQWLFVYDMTVL